MWREISIHRKFLIETVLDLKTVLDRVGLFLHIVGCKHEGW
jgi:hypothetical protein